MLLTTIFNYIYNYCLSVILFPINYYHVSVTCKAALSGDFISSVRNIQAEKDRDQTKCSSQDENLKSGQTVLKSCVKQAV